MYRRLILLAAVLLGSACKPTIAPIATSKEVDIKRTETKSQGSIGFCWAYTTIALLEGHVLRSTGKSLDLSEEALGFYRMLEELEHIASNPQLVAKVLETNDSREGRSKSRKIRGM